MHQRQNSTRVQRNYNISYDYNELDDIFFKKPESEPYQLRQNRNRDRGSGLGKVGERLYGDKKNFLKQLHECINYEERPNEIGDAYQRMIRTGYQPEVISLNKLSTHEQHLEYAMTKDFIRQDERQNQKLETSTPQRKPVPVGKPPLNKKIESTPYRHKQRRASIITIDTVEESKFESDVKDKAQVPNSRMSLTTASTLNPDTNSQASKKQSDAITTMNQTPNLNFEVFKHLNKSKATPNLTSEKARQDFRLNGGNVMDNDFRQRSNYGFSELFSMTPSVKGRNVNQRKLFITNPDKIMFGHYTRNLQSHQRNASTGGYQTTQASQKPSDSPLLRMRKLMQEEYGQIESNMKRI